MPSYLIKHQATGERRGPVNASCADEAANLQGWELAACEVEELEVPKNGQPPFIPTQDERDNIQLAIDRGLDEMTGFELQELRNTLRRWFEAQNWDS